MTEELSVPVRRSAGRAPRRALFAAAAGEFIEYYDFAIYGYLALSISATFFASQDPTVALLSTFAVYGGAFVVRPLGGLVFGHVGDRFGRRTALIWTLSLIGVSTTAVGVLPSHAAIGVAAPALLLLCRLSQGFSAGGEAVGASSLALEHAPENRRGLYNCVVIAASALPSAVAAVLVLALSTSLPEHAFDAFGWRIPFLLAFPLTALALYIRLRAEESPAFIDIKGRDELTRAPLRDALRDHGRAMLAVFLVCALSALGFYMLIGYFVTYMQVLGGLSREAALLSNCVALLVFATVLVICGRLSDEIGRRRLLLLGAPLVAIIAVPAFLLVGAGGVGAALLGQCLLAASLAVYGGGSYMVFVEIFPTANRYAGAAISFNLSFALFGGSAPYVSTWLVDLTGSNVAPGWYLTTIAILAFLVAYLVPETRRTDINTATSSN